MAGCQTARTLDRERRWRHDDGFSMVPLDTLLHQNAGPAIVKIDVEGMERNVLNSGFCRGVAAGGRGMTTAHRLPLLRPSFSVNKVDAIRNVLQSCCRCK